VREKLFRATLSQMLIENDKRSCSIFFNLGIQSWI
jgi:hypothetical protein